MAEILRWDTARYLNTEEDIEGYLDIIYEDGDEDLIALGEWNAERARRRLLRQQKHSDRCQVYPGLKRRGLSLATTVRRNWSHRDFRTPDEALREAQPVARPHA